MVIGWYLLLGGLLGAYFALAGYDYGVGLTLPGTPRSQRGPALNAIGPLFLGNEVWIVGAIGVLLAAFPLAEGELFTAAYPLIVSLILGLVAVNAGVQLRGRARRRAGFDLLIAAGSLVLAMSWGMLLGSVLAGLPAGGAAPGRLFGWYPWLSGLALLGIFGLHGSVYLAWRAPGDAGEAARARIRRLYPVTLGLVVLAVLGALGSAQVRRAVAQPVPAALLAIALLAALGAAGLAVLRGRYRRAFAATALAAALPVFLVGVARYPQLLHGLPVGEAAAGPGSLRLLVAVALPFVPVLVAAQVLCWWIFRQRADRPVPTYW